MNDVAQRYVKLVLAMGMSAAQNGCPLFSGALTIHSAESFKPCDENCGSRIVSSPRVGITLAADLPLRFHLKGSRYISR